MDLYKNLGAVAALVGIATGILQFVQLIKAPRRGPGEHATDDHSRGAPQLDNGWVRTGLALVYLIAWPAASWLWFHTPARLTLAQSLTAEKREEVRTLASQYANDANDPVHRDDPRKDPDAAGLIYGENYFYTEALGELKSLPDCNYAQNFEHLHKPYQPNAADREVLSRKIKAQISKERQFIEAVRDSIPDDKSGPAQ